jgi:guanylate kinase
MAGLELTLRKEFEAVLSDYHISEKSKSIITDLKLALFMGVTAAGRNTIINELIRTHGEAYYYIVSDTTRPPQVRNGKLEQNGVEYYFRQEAEILEDLKRGEFLEAEIIHEQQVSGMSIRELKKAKDLKKIAVTDTEFNSAEVRSIKQDTLTFFVIPPSIDAWMERLTLRGSMDPKEVSRRLDTALKMFSVVLQDEYFIIVVNSDFHETVKKVHRYITVGYPARSEMTVELETLDELTKAAHQYLAKHTTEIAAQ